MQAWDEFLKALELEIGSDVVTRWLRPLKVVRFDAANLYLEAESAFQMLWFEEHVRAKVRAHFLDASLRPIKVHVSITGKEAPAQKGRKKSLKASWYTPSPDFLFSQDSLFPFATLEQFVAASSNEVPLKFIYGLAGYEQKSELELGAFNPLFIYGEKGCGKTHLLMAIAHRLREQKLSAFYVGAESFTAHVVSGLKNSAMQNFRNTYRHVDVLLIDDIHLLAGRVATQEELFHTFNTLHSLKKQIIVSANVTPQTLDQIEMRLTSRFEWGILLKIQKLSGKDLVDAVLKRSAHFNLHMGKEGADFLTESFKENTHTLFEALDALALRAPHAHFNKESIERFAGDLILKEKQKGSDPIHIVQKISHYYGITAQEVLGKSQTQEIAMARQLAMYLCREQLQLSFVKIGKFFSRDHSTVMASIKLIKKKLEGKDPEIISALQNIKQDLLLKS